MYIIMNMGIIGATMDILYRFTRRTCSQYYVYRTYITLIASAIKSGNP